MLPKSEILDIATFSKVLSKRYLTNSYKIYWLYAIIEEIIHGCKEISFRRLVARMAAKSWYSILKYKLKLGEQDQLFLLVNYVFSNSDLSEIAQEDEIVKFIENSKDKKLIRLVRKFYKFVPYRLLTPFYYKEIQPIKESDRNTFLAEQSRKNLKFYKIIDTTIIINEEWYDYLYKNQRIVKGWIELNLVSFLQSRNPNTPSVINKIYPPINRNLSQATKFWKTIIEYNKNIRNIYTNDTVDLSDFSIDHFIPWSFVMHDMLWNLVPVSRSINSSKSDKLPDLKKYFNKFAKLQYYAFTTSLKLQKKKWLEDYLYLNEIELNLNFPENKFINSLQTTINPLYQIALNQGFQVWIK